MNDKKQNSPIRVVCGIIEKNELFLAARRAPDMSRPGLWELPGGKIEPGENPKRALKRELKEELAIIVTVGTSCGSTHHQYADIEIELIAYRCTIKSGLPKPMEHDRIRWINRKQASLLEWAPADLPILQTYLASP